MKKHTAPRHTKPMGRAEKDHALRDLIALGRNTDARLARIERLLLQLVRVDLETERSLMALKVTDQALISQIHRNTNVTQAATLALTSLQASVTDLTKKLADAIADSSAADDPDVQAALAELTANNDSMTAATPVVAAAVGNTDPSAPPPTVPAA